MNVKYRLENFSFYDHTGVARRLEQMAEKGWLLEKAGYVWKYRRIEPKKIAFTVTYCAHASVFDPEPSKEQQQFIDLCAHTGWVAVKSIGQMQIFYNEDPAAPPLNTEPAVELEGMHRAMKKNFLPVHIVLLICNVLQLYTFFGSNRNAATLLTSALSLGIMAGLLLLFLYYTSQLAGYFLYRRKALRYAETGLLLDVSPAHTRMTRLWIYLAIMALVLMAADMLLNGSYRDRMIVLFMLCIAAAELIVVYTVIWVLKKLKVHPKDSRILYGVISFIIIFALLNFGRGKVQDIMDDAPQPSLPFSLTAYDGKDYGEPYGRENSSFLARSVYVYQSGSQKSGMSYTLTTTRGEGLAKFVVRSLTGALRDIKLPGTRTVMVHNSYTPVDPTPWQADEVHRHTWGDGPIGDYIVRWGDTVLDVAYWDQFDDADDIPAELRKMLVETFKP